MNIHITNIHNIGGTAPLAQEGAMQVAKQLGFREMGILRRNFYEDYWNTISHQQDGIIAPLYFNDIVIFQYPSWNGPDFDRAFVNKIKMYHGTKLIIWVHDMQKLMFDAQEQILMAEMEILNQADLLILPSDRFREYLFQNGLNKAIPVIYQKIWEMPGYPQYTVHENRKVFLFTGNFDRFPFLREYFGKTPIEQFDGKTPDRKNDHSFLWKGYRKPQKLMSEIAQGGFGLVWSDEEYFKRYYSWNQPHKLGFNLAAGIPVVIRNGSIHTQFIKNNGLGYVVESLEEADELVQNTSDEKYQQMIQNVAKFQPLLLNGVYTQRLLLDAVIQVMEK